MAELREVRGLSHVEVTSDHDCSDLIAAMMRPRLPRFTLNLEDDDQKLDLFKQPKESFPMTEAQRLQFDTDWGFKSKYFIYTPRVVQGNNCGFRHSLDFTHFIFPMEFGKFGSFLWPVYLTFYPPTKPALLAPIHRSTTSHHPIPITVPPHTIRVFGVF